VASFILEQFLLGPYFSTYEIYGILNDKGIAFLSFISCCTATISGRERTSIAYKDIHKRIKRLNSLGLIERVPGNELRRKRTFHKPIFYRLTLGGLFNLLYKNRDIIDSEDKRKTFRHHGNNIIFNTFVYPYFELSTLVETKGPFVPEIIFDYVSKCCGIANNILEGLAKEKGSKIVSIPLFHWNEIPGEHDIETVRMLANEFEIDFSEDSKIEKHNHSRSIKISDQDHWIRIQVNRNKNSATLTVHDGRTFDLTTEKLNDELVVNKIGTFEHDIASSVMRDRVRNSLLNLAFSILISVKMGEQEGELVEDSTAIDKEDLRILARDTKAMRLIHETHKLFTERYKLLAKLNMNKNV
jgi:hypothetical protein